MPTGRRFGVRSALAAELTAEVDGEVRFDRGSRGAYATDASNYRQVPIAVVIPLTVDDGARAVEICARHAAPVLSRGGGTSLAGECCNEAVVIDWTKHCDGIVSVDVAARRAVVEPGIPLDTLNAALAEHGLMFGPKPATHSHCTIGGMIGNNSCGSTAQAYGKTVDNVARLEILTYGGERMWVGPTGDDELADIAAAGGARGALYGELQAIAAEYGEEIRARFPDIPRRVSGYNLDSLLPEAGFDVARALVGSESTLVTILHAELELVPVPAAKTILLLGFPSIADAGDAASAVVPHRPISIEGLDDVLIDNERSKGRSVALDLLPEGGAWLLVEMPGEDQDDADRRVHALVDALADREPRPTSRAIDDPQRQEQILEVRERGLGATAWMPNRPDTWPGWEDAAVAPERLGEYLRDFSGLLDRYGYEHVSLYGHFGQGCVHCRIPFDLTTEQGIERYDRFVHEAARLVTRYGGSLSGEHGDGQARGSLLPIMYGDRIMSAFRRLKRAFDPEDRMNPGKVVSAQSEPLGTTTDLRLGADYRPKVDVELHFSYPDDEGRFDRAALRCVGVGNCRGHSGGVMCPSYRATGEEEHSTRGRARLLWEMVNGPAKGGPITDGWRSEEVRDALDLCLSCKGCKSDCPVQVDMATYKAEFLAHHYDGRIRPAAHYSMGWLPRWARVARLAPELVNRLGRLPGLAPLAKRIAGIDPGRPLPRFASHRFIDWFRAHRRTVPTTRGRVILWPDTFTNHFHPHVAQAAVAVLEDAGYRIESPAMPLCCGLTWISTGQLDDAKRILARTAAALAPRIADGTPVVVLEPSCGAVFRSDGPDLLPGDPNVALLKDRTRTLAELLEATPDWTPPSVDRPAVVQPHCHQHAVLGFEADERLMRRAGMDVRTLEGCCGLAGNFGFEAGHLDVSIAAAEHQYLPGAREADEDAFILADGFSCRTQLEQIGPGRRAVHLAEVLAAGIAGLQFGPRPERDLPGYRPDADRVADETIERALDHRPVLRR